MGYLICSKIVIFYVGIWGIWEVAFLKIGDFLAGDVIVLWICDVWIELTFLLLIF